ncbi:MAG TPA: hypothetical protein VK724_11030 [Bryobacteraceae bacterium]|jgi:hypothetical protein|nr:hypothetical protein [Bryobacteraceae bacterium]
MKRLIAVALFLGASMAAIQPLMAFNHEVVVVTHHRRHHRRRHHAVVVVRP